MKVYEGIWNILEKSPPPPPFPWRPWIHKGVMPLINPPFPREARGGLRDFLYNPLHHLHFKFPRCGLAGREVWKITVAPQISLSKLRVSVFLFSLFWLSQKKNQLMLDLAKKKSPYVSSRTEKSTQFESRQEQKTDFGSRREKRIWLWFSQGTK